MNYNGILITSNQPIIPMVEGMTYRGLCYGEPWPLSKQFPASQATEDINYMVFNLTTGYSLEKGTYPPAVIPDLTVISKYVQQCYANGLEFRTLLCATPRLYPLLPTNVAQDLLKDSTFVGFDYAYSTCDFSAVFSDLNPPPSPELHLLSMTLNQNGVFSNLDDLEGYIDSRWDFLNNAERRMSVVNGMCLTETPLEGSGDFVPFEVHELNSVAFLK